MKVFTYSEARQNLSKPLTISPIRDHADKYFFTNQFSNCIFDTLITIWMP